MRKKQYDKRVTEQGHRKVTASKNSNFKRSRNNGPLLKERSIGDFEKDKRTMSKETRSIAEILSIWPKIVEYTGLSEYEAKVYLSLVGLGNSGARKLSLFCDVPRTKVYGTLKRLIDYGLVVEIPGTPKKFIPASPKDAFSAILNIVKGKANDFSSVVQTLSETHETVENDTGPLKKIVWYLTESSDIMEKCKKIISRTQTVVTVMTSADGLSLIFNSTHKILDKLLEKGVEVKLHSPLDPKKNPLARELSYLFEVEMKDIATPVIFIDSDHESFLLARVMKKGDEKQLESAIFSDDPGLLSMISLLLMDEKMPILSKPLM